MLPADSESKEVIWTSSKPEVATVNNGVVTAIADGTTTITVSTTDKNKATATCEITVRTPVESVKLNQNTAIMTLVDSKTLQLTATVAPAKAPNKEIKWTSSDENIATVDANGKVTAKATGAVTISAISKENETIKDSCTVTIYEKITISLNRTSWSGDKSQSSFQLVATVTPNVAPFNNVVWSCESTSGEISVDQNGLVKRVSFGRDPNTGWQAPAARYCLCHDW